ncbi:MAG: hypothetical protein N3A63_01935 [Bacteroidetes bacterium]|nr:hypothetical protein [Bacteroidota bacterium]
MSEKKYTIVCVTPVGRRRYMRFLVPLVLTSDITRYEFWLNTTNRADILFFELLAKKFPKINLIPHPNGRCEGNRTINDFYQRATEPHTIYVKLDDDIVWAEPHFLERLVQFRLTHPEFFFVTPLTINNALCTTVLQAFKKFEYPRFIHPWSEDSLVSRNTQFVIDLHQWFLAKILLDGYQELHVPPIPFGLNRFSINTILWFGETFQKFGGSIDFIDDEIFLSIIKPAEYGMANCIVGDVLVAHYAFFGQRQALDRTNVLDRYREALLHTYRNNKDFLECFAEVEAIFQDVEPFARTVKSQHYSPVRRWKDILLNIKVPLLRMVPLSEIKKNIESRILKIQ